MGAHLVQPGAVLADRYVIEDLLGQEAGSESWRARDRILARSVVLQLLPSASPNANRMLAAAKRASRVADSRILQVLDATDDGSLSYIVREWASGQSLDVLLSEGPLPAGRATWLLREVAGAMVNAHRMGLPHRRLVPDCVVVTKSSGVKLIGLGTSAVLRGEFDGDHDAELQDTLDLGRLLYACLTARWPGGDWPGLPPAPTEHGRLLRPRQVRAGVPRALDAVCDRILATHSRYGEPIVTVAEVKDQLSKILADEGFAATTGVNGSVTATPSARKRPDPPPALLVRDGASAETEANSVEADRPVAADRSTLRRTLTWAVAVVFILGLVLLAYAVGQRRAEPAPASTGASAGSGTGSPSQSQSGSDTAPRPLQIAGVTDFDPVGSGGSGDENPDLAPLATDGDPSTSWQTLRYFDSADLNGVKPGVGLVVDLGSVRQVDAVKVALGGNGTTVELRAAPESATQAPSASADDYQLLDTATQAQSTADFTLDQPASTRYLLIWLTSLPNDGAGAYRGEISEIQVLG